MKNLHERLTKNLGRRLLIGVFFIFLGMTPAIYIWSCAPNNKHSPIPIPDSPTVASVSNIEFNTNNDYLYDYSPPRSGVKKFKNNQYISLKDNQYIYYDNENKIDFINSDNKIIPIENQKIIKAVGQFNSKDVIILNNNDIFKIGLINKNSIEYINISKFDLDFLKPIFISQSSETTFNLIYTNKNNFISLLQFDTLTNVFYNHNILYQGKKIMSYDDMYNYQNGIIVITVYGEWRKKIKGKDINAELINNFSVGTEIESEIKGHQFRLKLIESDEWYLYWKETEDKKSYSNKAVVDFLNQIDKVDLSYPKKLYTVSNNEIINNNDDIVINENEIYTIPPFEWLYNLNSHTYDYKTINKDKIKIACYHPTDSNLKVWNKNKLIYDANVSGGDDLYKENKYIVNYSVYLNISATSNKIKVFYLGDMLTDDYNYLIYDGYSAYISVSENNLYIIDYTNGYLNIKYYDLFSKKMINKEFKNIRDIKLEQKFINFNNFYIYQGNYYFNIYENNTLKVFTNDNNTANINIDKYKITRYKNNLVVLTKDKCVLLNLDSKNTTEFNLKNFDFDNSNSKFINSNFDKSNILFRNVDNVSLFVFNI
uniref:Hypothetical transmembrane protein n=1 Tax=Spiroplasma citri TaxID=2133 RepID=Q3ZVR1_SPICI|nr:hypothetical protein [Spiroplasma citri]CAI84908.1 hypothetical transmembrane protein [Spiroplasma citri]